MSNENRIQRAYQLGQSFWLDYIRRDLLEDGELAGLIQANEIRGVTSNPSIFQQAIGESELYLPAMRPLAHAGMSAEQIFEVLAVEDIRTATDLFLPLYEGTDGRDGFVSIEVNPELAADTEQTLEEARRLWEWVNRPNLMVKIPATPEGVPAIEQAIFEGINVNVTLIFSLERYSEVMEAYIRGLERRMEEGESLQHVASVASFFVSRVDSAVDGKLEAIIQEEGPGAERARALLGKAAISNAKMAYAQFKLVFEGPRFKRLSESGARLQRPLWASTSTKNPSYSDVLYIDELIGQHTVNTVPPNTLDAFRDHGTAEASLDTGISDARAQLQALTALGISIHEITADLERDGVRAFAEAYASLLETTGDRAEGMRGELDLIFPQVMRYIERLNVDRVAQRFWRVDPELWPETRGGSVIKMRLEWLDTDIDSHLKDIDRLMRKADTENIERIGWIGEGKAQTALWESIDGDRTIVPLSTLDPSEQRSFARQTPVESTMFVVESHALVDPATMAKLAGVWRRAGNRLGDDARTHFLCLTPEGSQLAEWASEHNVGSLPEWNHSSKVPVSASGFLLAALLGGDPAELADGAELMRGYSSHGTTIARNPGLYLGAVLAAADEPTYLIADSAIQNRAEWLASYIKARAQLPVQVGLPQAHDDATLIYLRLDGELEGGLRAQDLPLVVLQNEPGLLGLGSESVRWEVGVGVAAHLLITPTYAGAAQVPASERLSKMVERHKKKGDFRLPKPDWEADYGSVWWSWRGQVRDGLSDLDKAAALIIEHLGEGRSLFIGLYQAPSRSIRGALTALREELDKTRRAWVTFEFGRPPEAKLADGYSLLVTGEPKQSLELPNGGMTYSDLQTASMLADFEQIKDAGGEVCGVGLRAPGGMDAFLKALADRAGITPESAKEIETRMTEDRS
ncbi:MAG: transaldolase [Anaerolineales bacterium]